MDAKAAAGKRRRTEQVTFEADGIAYNKHESADMGLPVDVDALRRVQERFQERCWGCEHEFDGRHDAPAPVRAMWARLMSAKGSMSEERLYAMLEEMFERLVRRPLEEEGKPAPRWPADMIRTHLREHVLHEYLAAVDDARVAHTVLRRLSATLFRKSLETGDLEPDHKTHDLYARWQQISSQRLRAVEQLRANPT